LTQILSALEVRSGASGRQLRKAEDTGNFVKIAVMIAVIALISTVAIASIVHRGRAVSLVTDSRRVSTLE
jgi:hypothetical protein